MSSPAVALAVFERWMTEGTLLTLFTPQGVGEASSHSAKVVALDDESLSVSLLLDDRTPKTFALRDAAVAYVERGEEADDTPEELSGCFAGRFLRLSFPSGLLFVIGETLM
jgi:hypothetical protein